MAKSHYGQRQETRGISHLPYNAEDISYHRIGYCSSWGAISLYSQTSFWEVAGGCIVPIRELLSRVPHSHLYRHQHSPDCYLQFEFV